MIQPMTRLKDLGLTLESIDLGGVDAEADVRLSEYFVKTPYVATALSGKRSIYIGRKGSGKSALFSQLGRLFGSSSPKTLVHTLTPDQYAWLALKKYEEEGLLAEQAHTNAWKLTLAIETAGTLLKQEKGDWSPEAAKAASLLQKFLSDNFGTVDPGLMQSATSIVKGLKSFNLSAFGFGVGFAKEAPDPQLLTPAVLESLINLIGVLVAECGVVVAIDRLDDSWDGSEKSRSLLIGLLKASKELNDRFRNRDSQRGLRVYSFIRSDIYDSLSFDDKDKHRSLEESISWDFELLREMVNRRLPESVTIDDVFEASEMRGSLKPFNYLLKRTFLRPREVLQFLEECMRQTPRGATEISKDQLRAAEEKYSRWKMDDLMQEFSKVLPDFSRILLCLRQEVHRYDSFADLEDLISKKEPAIFQTHGARKILEILFDCSVIGVRIANQGSTRFKAEDSNLELPSSGALYVHQSLHKGLNITETRAGAN